MDSPTPSYSTDNAQENICAICFLTTDEGVVKVGGKSKKDKEALKKCLLKDMTIGHY